MNAPLSQPAQPADDGEMPDRLRVCSVLTSLTTGGAENLILNLGAAFGEAGADHDIVALCDAETLGNSGSTEAAMRERIIADGSRFRSLGLNARRGVLKGAIALARCRRELRPHLWHFHTARAASMAALARLPEPAILTHHNSRLTFPPAMFRIFDTAIAAYVAISPETEAIYRTHSRRPVRPIANAAGGNFRAESPRNSVHNPMRILSVGAVSPQKNYPLLIDVAQIMRQRLNPAEMPVFSIAGGGDGLEELRSQVDRLGLTGCVHFLGERQDVRNLLEQSDLLLNTSLYEGMAISMIEAMSMALPVVATPVPGNVGMVRHGEDGLLAERADASAIADALTTVMKDAQLYRNLSAGALESSRRYSIGTCAKAHLGLYRELLGRADADHG